MRVSRLRLNDFRGWADLDLRPRGHVLVAGVPRAGRTDVIAALRRLLDPASVRLQPALSDIRQKRAAVAPLRPPTAPSAVTASGVGDEGGRPVPGGMSSGHSGSERDTAPSVTYAHYAEVEATLVDLDPELEQLCDGYLEPLDADGQMDESGSALPGATLGVRLAYRVSYDARTDSLEHVVYFPLRSKPDVAQYHRVPTAVRRALPVVALNTSRPLQLRAEGMLRHLVNDRDLDAAASAFRALEHAVAVATSTLSADATVAATVDAVLQVDGVARRLGDTPATAADVEFRPDDGSLSGLLRSVQPALDLDGAGLLALTSHGSTASSVLTAAEALVLTASMPGAVVLGDDVGEGLDTATAEHVASALRARAAQVWLTTRRPEVARAFNPGELVRLTRRGDTRAHHVLLEPTDSKEIAIRRLFHTQLLPALTASSVAITEGPHDLTSYSSADRHRALAVLPLSAHGVRLISADNGSGGGTTQIPRVAGLAHALGFRVIALVDCDPAKTSATVLAQIEAACDVVVRLPAGMALEKAITAGAEVAALRTAASVLPAYGIDDPTVGQSDRQVPDAVAQLLHKKGLHEQFLDALVVERGELPPVLQAALDAVAVGADPGYGGPARIDLQAPPAPAAAAATP